MSSRGNREQKSTQARGPEVNRHLRDSLRFVAPKPVPGTYQTSHSAAELAMDLDRDGGWILTLDEVMSSYVDLSDLTHLEFEYTRWIGDLLDMLEPAGAPLRIAHLGGAGCTLPIYVELTRPGSSQIVFDYDEKLIDLVKESFGIRSSRRLKLRAADALAGLQSLPEGSMDVVIRDAFGGPTTPLHLVGADYLREVRRVLREGGVYIANIGDRPPLRLTTTEVHSAQAAFGLSDAQVIGGRMAILTDPSILRGRRHGNVVLAVSTEQLPLTGWMRATSRAALPARVVHGERLLGLVAEPHRQ